MCEYISRKKDVKEEIRSPTTITSINLILICFRHIKNCKIVKNKDSQRAKFPKEGAIS